MEPSASRTDISARSTSPRPNWSGSRRDRNSVNRFRADRTLPRRASMSIRSPTGMEIQPVPVSTAVSNAASASATAPSQSPAAHAAPAATKPRNGYTHGLSVRAATARDRKSTRLNSSHDQISYAVFGLKKKKLMIIPEQKTKSLFNQKGKRGNRQCISFLQAFFFNDAATTEIYTLSLHDALPI